MTTTWLAKSIAALGVVILVILAAMFWNRFSETPTGTPPGGQVACTMEAKLCPDGSAVGRVPPSCEFAACPGTTSTIPAGWKQASDVPGVSFAYPETIGTSYISTAEWPPRTLRLRDTVFSCAQTGTSTAVGGQTELITVNGRTYCVTRESEGAAGSTYTQYTYSFSKGADLILFNFSLRAVQCANYDDPQKTACEAERAAFYPNILADQMAQTFTVSE